jgi:D-inositol-3-phosphate glycosyltransferase
MRQNLQSPQAHAANPTLAKEFEIGQPAIAPSTKLQPASAPREIAVTLLTGGIDRPYTFGLAMELISKGASLEMIGSDGVDFPEFHSTPGITFLNLQGSQRADVSLIAKVLRLLLYYVKVMRYAAAAKPKIFHILWNNKFLVFDRTLLTIFYRLLRKKIVLTVHNVNAARRDSKDTFLNRLSLRIQYRLADHIFVHSQKMRCELLEEFGVAEARVTVIPFGINNAVPSTSLSGSEARQRLGIQADKKTILFFGRITPYKGLEYLISAFQQLAGCDGYRLIVVGRPENDCQSYWSEIQERIREDVRLGRILLRAEHIPDAETEIYFKAADVLVLPYRQIYHSGVLFLGYSFGLPVLAADVGPLKEEIVEGETGSIFKPEDSADLVRAIESYFASNLFTNLDKRRREIREYASERHSWDVVGKATLDVYRALLKSHSRNQGTVRKSQRTTLDTNTPS